MAAITQAAGLVAIAQGCLDLGSHVAFSLPHCCRNGLAPDSDLRCGAHFAWSHTNGCLQRHELSCHHELSIANKPLGEINRFILLAAVHRLGLLGGTAIWGRSSRLRLRRHAACFGVLLLRGAVLLGLLAVIVSIPSLASNSGCCNETGQFLKNWSTCNDWSRPAEDWSFCWFRVCWALTISRYGLPTSILCPVPYIGMESLPPPSRVMLFMVGVKMAGVKMVGTAFSHRRQVQARYSPCAGGIFPELCLGFLYSGSPCYCCLLLLFCLVLRFCLVGITNYLFLLFVCLFDIPAGEFQAALLKPSAFSFFPGQRVHSDIGSSTKLKTVFKSQESLSLQPPLHNPLSILPSLSWCEYPTSMLSYPHQRRRNAFCFAGALEASVPDSGSKQL